MPTLAIAFLLFLNLFSLSAQSSDTIELDRDIHYERNPHPDIGIPDIYLLPVYPELPDRRKTAPTARMAPTSIRELYAEEPGSILSASAVMTPPRVTTVAAGKNSGNSELSLGLREGWLLSGDYLIEGTPSSFFWLTAADYEDLKQFFGWAGYGYTGDFSGKLTAGGNWQDEPLLAVSILGSIDKKSLHLQYWQHQDESLFIPRADTRFILSRNNWAPYAGVLVGGVLGGHPEYRVRPSLGILGRGQFGSAVFWNGEAGLAAEFDSFSESFHYYGTGYITLRPGSSMSLKVFFEIEEPSSICLMAYGLASAALPPVSPLVSQNGGVLLSMNSSVWSGSLKSGYKWGTFLRYREDTFRIVKDTVPYGELVLTKKSGPPVTDISLSAEYLNREEWQYRLENRWYFYDSHWSVGVKVGHYQMQQESLFAPIAVAPFRTGGSILYRHSNQWLVEVFTDYLPEDSEFDGGITFRVSF